MSDVDMKKTRFHFFLEQSIVYKKSAQVNKTTSNTLFIDC